MKRIRSLTRFGKSGWEFTLANGKSYRTNGNGEGLWVYAKSGNMVRGKYGWEPHYEFRQVEGTGQFDLPRDRKKAQNKIYRYFEEE